MFLLTPRSHNIVEAGHTEVVGFISQSRTFYSDHVKPRRSFIINVFYTYMVFVAVLRLA